MNQRQKELLVHDEMIYVIYCVVRGNESVIHQEPTTPPV